MTLSAIGATIIALLALWLLGGLLLRVGGVLLILAGALGIATTSGPNGILLVAIGVPLWLAGHWHYALRHQGYKSPLARHLFCRLAPGWLDPSRGWAVAVVEDEPVSVEPAPGRSPSQPDREADGEEPT
ncbi:MAG: hypothetical protein FVQ78_05830 [Solirubrobacterales bacterium]|nr:hypothetical protein [Solirubrobacterales bacterium]